jgi:hypothetical protein
MGGAETFSLGSVHEIVLFCYHDVTVVLLLLLFQVNDWRKLHLEIIWFSFHCDGALDVKEICQHFLVPKLMKKLVLDSFWFDPLNNCFN